jgi:hypothetical protein
MTPFLQQFVDRASFVDWPEFHQQTKHMHDWRTYVPTELRDKAWDALTLETRCALVAAGEEMADREDWDI